MATAKTKAPEQTFEEVKYLKHLIDNKIPVRVRVTGDEDFRGVIEFFDSNLIRLTRKDEPNLFLYKHDIKYISEEAG